MPEGSRQVVAVRSESHSDVAATKPARALQEEETLRAFGERLAKQLRTAGGDVRLSHYKEEWHTTDDGMVLEISAELEPAE